MPQGVLIGREAECDQIQSALAAAAHGRGGLLLLGGDAGIGKTRLAATALARDAPHVLHGAARPGGGSPYGAVVAAVRAALRDQPGALDDLGPLRAHLSLLLPELGAGAGAPAETEHDTLFEALRAALDAISAAGRPPLALLLDDLQWSDDATLELLGALAPWLATRPILVVAVYRSDETPRGHPVRRLRTELRRAGVLTELSVGPLDQPDATALATQILGAAPTPALAQALHDRAQGVPFFVEELATALIEGGRLQATPDGVALVEQLDLPIPETLRDAILLRAADLDDDARCTAEVAAVAGPRFDIDLVASLGCENGFEALVRAGLIADIGHGCGAFRHTLTRDALYDDIPWLRRRSLHRKIAAAREEAGAPATEVAAHHLAAGDQDLAVGALLRATDELAAVHAHRDAARAARQALELWPEDERAAERLATLDRYAHVAELAGDLPEAARALREAASARRAIGIDRALGDAERRLAAIFELEGDRARAIATHRAAAETYAAAGLPGEAAGERLAAAALLQSAGGHTDAIDLAAAAAGEASQASRDDLRARALGLQGVALAKRGARDEGFALIRDGLSVALERELTSVAAELYQRLATAREVSGDYSGAQDALATAVGLCPVGTQQEHVCLSCMAYVLRELGEWDEAAELSRTLEAGTGAAATTMVVDGILGAIHGFRGDAANARPLLARCLATATKLQVVSMLCDSAAALSLLDAQTGDAEGAAEHARLVLRRWEGSEDHHYAVWGLRWAAAHLAANGALGDARACAEALSSIVTDSGYPDAMAALAHALGETALAEGDADAAADQIVRAADLHRGLNIPFEHAQIQHRAGVALAAAGRRDAAIERLVDAHRTARRLCARPLARQAASALAQLGEPLERHVGRRAAAAHDGAGLSRRELEVMRLVAAGHTNREIAGELVVSRRTVDMHVRNILAKLGCRSRTEAAGRAAELGILEPR